jgi:Cu/Ag efflux protein CusF
MPVPPAPVTAPAWLAAGKVRRIDRSAGTVSIQHRALPALALPASTSTFRVADPGFLDQLRSGRRIRFSAAKIDGVLTMTHLDAAH